MELTRKFLRLFFLGNMTFKDIYKPPFVVRNDMCALASTSVKVFSAFTPDAQEHMIRIVKIINGDPSAKKYNKGDIISQDSKLCICGSMIFVRGWGMLTGIGGYHLPREEAAKIQDEFINWLIDKITI